MKKKLLTITMSLIFVLALVGCGNKTTDNGVTDLDGADMPNNSYQDEIAEQDEMAEMQSVGTPAIPDDAVTMQGKIVEIDNGRLIIEPVEGSAELKSSDSFSVPIEHMDASPEPQVGYTVEIFYDGSIEETYPAMLGTVYYVRVVVESMTTDCEAVNPDDKDKFKDYTQKSDGTWECEGNTYKYKLEITGRMNNATCDTTFVYLSNIEEITFEQAWKGSGLSSDMKDYFDIEDAVLVMWQNNKE